jgi:hypothetical protein
MVTVRSENEDEDEVDPSEHVNVISVTFHPTSQMRGKQALLRRLDGQVHQAMTGGRVSVWVDGEACDGMTR